MRIVLFLVAFGATMTLTTVSLAKTQAKREVASESLTCSSMSTGSVEYEIVKCRSDRSVAVYEIGQGYSKLCCVRN